MAKFKVGDKVRVRSDLIGKMYFMEDKVSDCLFADEMERHSGKVVTIAGIDAKRYYIKEDDCMFHWVDEMFSGLATEQPRREFIVIHRDGNVMTAEHRVNREVIKSGTATCNVSDKFDFDMGAKLAFDRLMNRQNIEEAVKAWNEPAPQPAHRFKVGDRVKTPKGTGTVVFVDDQPDEEKLLSYLVQGDKEWNTEVYVAFSSVHDVKDGKGKYWFEADELSHAPAPEPPKFYTGKVFAEKIIECDAREGMHNRIGRVFEIKNGIIQGDVKQYDLDDYDPIVSFSDFCLKAGSTKWHEVKSDV